MSNSNTTTSNWLSPNQIATEFNISPDTLQAFRTKGGGCRFSKIGRKTVRYLRSDFEAWLSSCSAGANAIGATSPREAFALAASRLGALQLAADSLAMLTPGGATIPGAKALATDLGREVDAFRTMAGEGGAA